MTLVVTVVVTMMVIVDSAVAVLTMPVLTGPMELMELV